MSSYALRVAAYRDLYRKYSAAAESGTLWPGAAAEVYSEATALLDEMFTAAGLSEDNE
jgi:hypothetical protein